MTPPGNALTNAPGAGLGHPGGPAIAQAAANFSQKEGPKIRLPRPMLGAPNFDFSFSGLKTAVVNKIRELEKKGPLSPTVINALAWEIQEAISDCLVGKTLKAAAANQAKAVLLGGGVCANQRLREKLEEENRGRFSLFIPKPSFCTDNAAPYCRCRLFSKTKSRSPVKPQSQTQLKNRLEDHARAYAIRPYKLSQHFS